MGQQMALAKSATSKTGLIATVLRSKERFLKKEHVRRETVFNIAGVREETVKGKAEPISSFEDAISHSC